MGPGGAETKRTQLLPTRNPPKQTFNVMGRAIREIHVVTLWLQILGCIKISEQGWGTQRLPEEED